MNWFVLLAAAVLAGVAAGGILRPFGSGRMVVMERLADPLEDERAGLLRTLRELEDERARGGPCKRDENRRNEGEGQQNEEEAAAEPDTLHRCSVREARDTRFAVKHTD